MGERLTANNVRVYEGDARMLSLSLERGNHPDTEIISSHYGGYRLLFRNFGNESHGVWKCLKSQHIVPVHRVDLSL